MPYNWGSFGIGEATQGINKALLYWSRENADEEKLKQKEENTAAIKAMEQAGSVSTEAAKEGVWRGYQPRTVQSQSYDYEKGGLGPLTTTETGQYELSAQGKEAMQMGGQARFESLQGISTQKAEEIRIKRIQDETTIANMKTDQALKISKDGSAMYEDAFKKFEKYGENYRPFFQAQVKAANQAFEKIDIKTDITVLDDLATARQKLKEAQLDAINKKYAVALEKPTAGNIAELTKLLPAFEEIFDVKKESLDPIYKFIEKAQENILKPPERPYKIGQRLPGMNVGDKEVTQEVTGYDENGQPITRTVGEAPRYKPNQVTLSPAQTATIANQLRNTVKNNPYIKEFQDIDTKYNVMLKAYDVSKTGKNMIAVDQALITLFNKMTDPQSVVRESEYARTPENMSLVNQIKGKVEKIMKGGAGLTATERAALTDMGKTFYQVYATRYNEVLQDTDDMATLQGINPKIVTGQYRRRDAGGTTTVTSPKTADEFKKKYGGR